MRNRWQLISRDGDLFNILKETQTWLSTVELPDFGFDEDDARHANYRYESCLFTGEASEVVARYQSLSEAIEGHNLLAKKFNLR